LSTAYARLRAPSSSAECTEALREAYRGERFVRVAESPDTVSLRKVVGTNDCLVGVACAGDRLVVVSAIDNLIKGAAGQAVQNLNLALGWEEAAGLRHLRRTNA
jgi:N-acetyl-gamma-glutamyl-phosphate reductase